MLEIAIIVAEDSAEFSGIHRNIPHGTIITKVTVGVACGSWLQKRD
jgi:hypothetical protein